MRRVGYRLLAQGVVVLQGCSCIYPILPAHSSLNTLNGRCGLTSRRWVYTYRCADQSEYPKRALWSYK